MRKVGDGRATRNEPGQGEGRALKAQRTSSADFGGGEPSPVTKFLNAEGIFEADFFQLMNNNVKNSKVSTRVQYRETSDRRCPDPSIASHQSHATATYATPPQLRHILDICRPRANTA